MEKSCGSTTAAVITLPQSDRAGTSGLPAEPERHGDVVRVAAASHEDMVVAGLGEKLPAIPRSESDSQSAVHARLIDRIGSQHLLCGNRHGEKTKEGIEARNRGNAGSGEVLVPMIQTAAADQIHVKMSVRIQMHHGVKRRRKNMNAPAGETEIAQNPGVDSHGVVIQL